MVAEDKKAKDRGAKGRKTAESNRKSDRAKEKASDEGELSPITPKSGEPSDNLRRRSEWFQKRHGRG